MSFVRSHNSAYFEFLRRRIEFVMGQTAADSIEGYVVWGAATDALARIHARRLGRTLAPNRTTFTKAIEDLLPDLNRVSVPLLAHDLRLEGGSVNVDCPGLAAYRQQASRGQIWHWTSDPMRSAAAAVSARAERILRDNSYPHILYEEYRCCSVHGLELGYRTFSSPDVKKAPGYMNYLYGPDDSRTAKRSPRTRLCFPLDFLGSVLLEAIEKEETEAADSHFEIPAYPTLDD